LRFGCKSTQHTENSREVLLVRPAVSGPHMIELTREHLKKLITPKVCVHDTVLNALCEILCLPRCEDDTILLDIDFMKYHKEPVKEWVKRLRRRRITRDSTIILPLHDDGHFSVLELRLRDKMVQHHDSLVCHSGNKMWSTAVQKLGTELLNQLDTSRDENTTTRLTDKVNVQDPDVTLRTQDTDSNTCLIHSFQFIYDIVCKRRPTPMIDSDAEQNRSVLANQLWQNMKFVGERHEHATYPGKYI